MATCTNVGATPCWHATGKCFWPAKSKVFGMLIIIKITTSDNYLASSDPHFHRGGSKIIWDPQVSIGTASLRSCSLSNSVCFRHDMIWWWSDDDTLIWWSDDWAHIWRWYDDDCLRWSYRDDDGVMMNIPIWFIFLISECELFLIRFVLRVMI